MSNTRKLPNILVLGNYNSSKNVYYSEIETFLGLQDFGFYMTILGAASSEVRTYFEEKGLIYIDKKPSKKFDSKFAEDIQDIIIKRKLDILYIRNGKYLKSLLPFIKKGKVKIITYYGSSSLHWYDPFAYLSYLHPKVDKIVCNSEFVYSHVKKQLINKSKAVKIYKGYDVKWFDEVKPFDYSKLDIPQDHIKIIMVARNSKVKDIPTYLLLANEFKNNLAVHFILVGDKLTEQKLKKENPKLINSNLHLLGFRKDAPELIKGADIYVQTSKSEGLGRAISEADAMGKAVVITNAGGCTELVNDMVSGFIVAVGDFEAMADKIKILIESPELRQQMGNNSRLKIENDLPIQNTIQGFQELFISLS